MTAVVCEQFLVAVWERVGLSHEDSFAARPEGLGVDPDQCGFPDLDFQGCLVERNRGLYVGTVGTVGTMYAPTWHGNPGTTKGDQVDFPLFRGCR